MAVLLNIPGPSGPSGRRHAILALSRRPNMAELAGDRIKPSLRHPPGLLLVILSVPFSLLSGPYLVSPVLPPGKAWSEIGSPVHSTLSVQRVL